MAPQDFDAVSAVDGPSIVSLPKAVGPRKAGR